MRSHHHKVFDLKGSKIKRKITGYLTVGKLRKLTDMNFMDSYPLGIRTPANIYHKLKMIIGKDAKILKKISI